MKVRDEADSRRFVEYLGECGLVVPLRDICAANFVTLGDIYLDVRGTSVLAARLEVWWTMMNVFGKSPGEIGRIFDRDRGSVSFGLKRIYTMAEQQVVRVEQATIRVLCLAIARDVDVNLRRSGLQVAPLGIESSRRRKVNGAARIRVELDSERVMSGREDRDSRSPIGIEEPDPPSTEQPARLSTPLRPKGM